MSDWGRILQRALQKYDDNAGLIGLAGLSGENSGRVNELAGEPSETRPKSPVVSLVSGLVPPVPETSETRDQMALVSRPQSEKLLTRQKVSGFETNETSETSDVVQVRAYAPPFGPPPGLPYDWVRGVEDLVTADRPEGFSPTRWDEVVDDAFCLVREYGTVAAFFRWDALDLFGCDPTNPDGCHDRKGLALCLCGGEVASLVSDRAHIRRGSETIVVRRQDRSGLVPLWEVCRGCR